MFPARIQNSNSIQENIFARNMYVYNPGLFNTAFDQLSMNSGTATEQNLGLFGTALDELLMQSGNAILLKPEPFKWSVALPPEFLSSNNSALGKLNVDRTEQELYRQELYKKNYQRQKDFVVMKSKIRQLTFAGLELPADDDSGALSPTDYAANRILQVLENAYDQMKDNFYRGVVSTSFDGGIRLEWMYPNASIRLIVPPTNTGREYIFFEDDTVHGTEPVSGETLARRLIWLKTVTLNE